MIARNVTANALGMVVTIAVQIGMSFGAYRLAGAEQYGLIGFYSTAMTAAAIFDIGLGQAVVREAARRRSLDRSDPSGVRPVVFNFLLLYLALAAVIAVGVAAASPLIARYWLHPDKLSVLEVERALMLMGVAIAVQRVRGVFQSALDGIERQVVTNSLLIVTNLLRLVLGLGALFLWPSALAFFAGQALASLVETAAFAVASGRLLPPSDHPARFNPALIVEAGRFALVNAAGAAVGTGVQIADSLVISAALPLSVFGNYSLVSSMCTVMLRLTAPILNAAYPRTAAYVREERLAELKKLFLGYSEASSAILATAAFALIFFAGPLITLVSGKPQVGADFAPVLATLSAAYVLNGVARSPHLMQMAEGRPGIALKINLALGAIYLPAIIWFTPRYGVMAPAVCLVAGNGLALTAFILTGFRRRLAGLTAEWLRASVAPQFIAAAVVLMLTRLGADAIGLKNTLILTGVAVVASGLALAVGLIAGPQLRFEVIRRLKPSAPVPSPNG